MLSKKTKIYSLVTQKAQKRIILLVPFVANFFLGLFNELDYRAIEGIGILDHEKVSSG